MIKKIIFPPVFRGLGRYCAAPSKDSWRMIDSCVWEHAQWIPFIPAASRHINRIPEAKLYAWVRFVWKKVLILWQMKSNSLLFGGWHVGRKKRHSSEAMHCIVADFCIHSSKRKADQTDRGLYLCVEWPMLASREDARL